MVVYLVHLVALICLDQPNKPNNGLLAPADCFSMLLETRRREKLKATPASMLVKPFATYSAAGYSADRASRS
jgi:hypothetical protein